MRVYPACSHAATCFAAVHESAFGTKRTYRDCLLLVRFGGKADLAQLITRCLTGATRRHLLGVALSAWCRFGSALSAPFPSTFGCGSRPAWFFVVSDRSVPVVRLPWYQSPARIRTLLPCMSPLMARSRHGETSRVCP